MTNEQLYTKIRAGFVSKGTSLNKWCKQNGYHRQNAYAAIMGEWRGEKATEFLNLLIVESGCAIATHFVTTDSDIDLALCVRDADVP